MTTTHNLIEIDEGTLRRRSSMSKSRKASEYLVASARMLLKPKNTLVKVDLAEIEKKLMARLEGKVS